MVNITMQKFEYPAAIVKDYGSWCLLLRREQVTLGSLVLICKDNAIRYSEISKKAFQEYPEIVKQIENTLYELFEYDKINYLMLMMIDPNVHFHIIPRYAGSKVFKGTLFNDHSWPSSPDLSKHNNVSSKMFSDIKSELITAFLK